MENDSPSPPPPLERKVDTLPPKRLRHAITVDESSRGRAGSLPITSVGGTGEATAPQQRSKVRRGQLTKQRSVHHDPDALDVEGGIPKVLALGYTYD